MTDVAQAAAVSQSTVSMVLNQVAGARLSAATRTRVLGVAARLGYRLPHGDRVQPNLLQVRNVIGYLVDEISTSPHPVVSVDGARDAAWEQGCVLHVAVTRNNPDQEAAALHALLANPALLGVVYSTIFTRQVRPPAQLLQRPALLLNCHDADKRLSAVVPGEVTGGHTATEHLIQQGHRRIGFINGEAWMEAAQDRLKGYRRALATADLPFDPALVRSGDWMSGSGFEGTLRLLQLADPPSAIFCANDLMALGALEAIKQRGLRVPEDVSVMGYDDQEISRHTHPPLSTLVLPSYEMGQVAVEQLLRLARSPSVQGSLERPRRLLTKIDGPLVLRDSVARAPPR
jgi:LacI family transcriptional regulator